MAHAKIFVCLMADECVIPLFRVDAGVRRTAAHLKTDATSATKVIQVERTNRIFTL
jgi:hypothetical protein